VLHDLAHLPGVRPWSRRVVSVRLVAGHRSRRVEIMGVEPAGELRRLVTRTLGRVEVAPEGLVMSAALARILGIAPGDPVTVEVLEGRRPVRLARVAATVEDILGLNVTMDIRALNRLLGEGGTVSGLYRGDAATLPNRLSGSSASRRRRPVRESMPRASTR
jgi:putative ABC transport system permease protein